MTMDEETAKRLDALHEDAKLSEAAAHMRTGWYAEGPYHCIAPGDEETPSGKRVCGKRILTPRRLKDQSGRSYITLAFCSQSCHDAWIGQFKKVPGPHWAKLDQEGNLIGYVLPKRGFVPLSEIERERDDDDAGASA